MHDFTNQPIRLITGGVGGGSDLLARLIAQELIDTLRQQVIVENRSSGAESRQIVPQAPTDGITLLLAGTSFWVAPLMQNTPYDPVRDFSPITLATSSPLVVVVHPSVAANSIKELIALAHARPGELKYASGFNGSSSQLAGALFTHMAGVDIVRVSYKSGGLVGVDDLIAGKVHVMIPSAGSGMPQVKAGKLRALAVTSAEPSALFPELPTVAASGLPGYEAVQTLGLFAPAKTPATVIRRLNHEIVRFLKSAQTKEQLLNAGLEAVGSTPEELATKVESEMAKFGKAIKDVGVHAN